MTLSSSNITGETHTYRRENYGMDLAAAAILLLSGALAVILALLPLTAPAAGLFLFFGLPMLLLGSHAAIVALGSRLTISPAGLFYQAGFERFELPWSQIEGYSRLDGPPQEGGAIRTGLTDGLLTRDGRVIDLAPFAFTWRDGPIGRQIRQYVQPPVSQAVPRPRAVPFWRASLAGRRARRVFRLREPLRQNQLWAALAFLGLGLFLVAWPIANTWLHLTTYAPPNFDLIGQAIGLLGLPAAGLLLYNRWAPRLVVTLGGIEWRDLTCTRFYGWEQIVRVESVKLENQARNQVRVEIHDLLVAAAADGRYKYLDLTDFDADWLNGDLGALVRRYAPWAFAPGPLGERTRNSKGSQ